ncbi:hypothetical protein J4230_02720 [Candidatus Woesearchaeota archaeon]|nr:hypothetical protein [Candidatus Woesearchaeota archaeon]
MKKTITIAGILAIIGVIVFLIWFIPFWLKVVSDPTNPKNIEEVATKTVEETIPEQVSVISTLAPYGIVGAILIVLIIGFWDKIMNFKIPLR